jgi:hypothetical protein
MILETRSTNILSGELLDGPDPMHIAFAVNVDLAVGYGLASQVSTLFWHDLSSMGRKELGTVLVHNHSGRVFHALVCHIARFGGWAQTPHWLKVCLDNLDAPSDAAIHIAKIGDGPVGREQGADVNALLEVLKAHPRQFIVYSL